MYTQIRHDYPGPVFVMSAERSGSNLLRTLLSNHSGIADPPAIQILPGFLESVGLYGDLTSNPSRLQLAGELIAVATREPCDGADPGTAIVRTSPTPDRRRRSPTPSLEHD